MQLKNLQKGKMETQEYEALDRFRGRYGRQDLIFSMLNDLLGRFVHSPRIPVPQNPQRILLANAGHLGDVIISTALFPVLKHAFPDAKIDFLTGTYSHSAIEGHPFLSRITTLDHWRSTRVKQSLFRRIVRFY